MVSINDLQIPIYMHFWLNCNCRGATASAGRGTRAQGNQCVHERHKVGRARKEISARMKYRRRC